ncbi:hypothetical protein D9M68_285440 [compost metagenome]
MTTHSLRSTVSTAALVAFGGFFMACAPLASAQAPGSDARMQKERATCDGVQQDRAACLREAGAARQEAGRHGLTTPGAEREDATPSHAAANNPWPTAPIAKRASAAVRAPPPKAA